MKHINILFALIITAILFSCKDEVTRPEYNEDELGRYVSFALVLDDNGDLTFEEVNTKDPYATKYAHDAYTAIKLPVTLTALDLEHEVKVKFDIEAFGDYDNYIITPASQELTFNGEKYTDTIYFEGKERWDTNVIDSFIFTLSEVSDPSFSIGYPYGLSDNSSLTVELEELVFPYTLDVNSMTLLEDGNTSYNFNVLFPNGFLASEFNPEDLLIETSNANINYTLTADEFTDGDTEIGYTYTVIDALTEPNINYLTEFELADIDGYSKFGYTELALIKVESVNADSKLNIARHFYDVSADFYNRLYTWFYMQKTDECKWNKSSQFCIPVPVNKNHPNAVLHEDGNYYHAFQIGFNTPNGSGTSTNSLALKSWFENESSSGEASPGFNIKEALEFHPSDSLNALTGMVKIIEQDIIISSKSDIAYTFAIDGEGSYYYLEGSYETYGDSIYQLDLLLEVTSEEVLGGTVKMHYSFINTENKNLDTPPEPADSDDPEVTKCFQPVTLL